MESVEVMRRAVEQATRESAIHKNDASIQAAQSKAQDYGSDLFALPCDASQWGSLQDLDPTSATYGLFYPTTGY